VDPLLHDAPGEEVLLLGNEAIARGALEAGVRVCAAYPGSPSSEILSALARADGPLDVHTEWSANEKVALEVASGASFAGLRALASMKQNGLNVAADSLTAMAWTGCGGGLVVVVCDDPGGISSTNEVDARHYARLAHLPLLEPGSFQEAKDLVRWAFELSEALRLPCLVRSVTRISHARGVVTLGTLERPAVRASLRPGDRWASLPVGPSHSRLEARLDAAKARFEASPFNRWEGPDDPELLVVTCGTGGWYTREAIRMLGVEARVGVLTLATTWPLPSDLIRSRMRGVPTALVVEETDPFLEDNVRALLGGGGQPEAPRLLGADALPGSCGPRVGELSPDRVADGLARILALEAPGSHGLAEVLALPAELPAREIGFCPACPHRASFWLMRNALRLDGRDGVVIGDIGCYSLGFLRTGFRLSRTMHSMGSAVGFSAGLGQLARFGFDQPVLAVVGDSTFFHACLPGLVSARYNGASFVCVVLDNSATAMTGFQPHPGTGRSAAGGDAPRLSVDALCEGMGIPVHSADPFEPAEAQEVLSELLDRGGLSVLILRQPCALWRARQEGPPAGRIRVDSERCLGDACGCGRFCTVAFGCPALIWDASEGRTHVDDVLCSRCGLCVSVCPVGAIRVEDER